MRNILLDKNIFNLKKCFKITLKNGEIFGFTDNSTNLNIDNVFYNSSCGFDSNNEKFYSDLTVGESNIVGFIENKNISVDKVLSGKFDSAIVEIFFINTETLEKIHITKGSIKSINLIDGKIFINISNVLNVLDKNIGEVYSPMCRASFCDKKCSLNIDNFSFNGVVIEVKSDVEFLCSGDDIINKDKNYFKYGVIYFSNNQSMEVKQSFNNDIILSSRLNYTIKVGDNFKIVAGCNKTFDTCCNNFDNAINFRGEPFISTTTKMYKFY